MSLSIKSSLFVTLFQCLFLLFPRCSPQLQTSPCTALLGQRGQYTCTHKRLQEVPLNIPPETQILDLSHNNIHILHEDNLRDLSHLARLVMDNNTLWKITEYAFRHLAQLQELSLSNNRLVIQWDSFSSTAIGYLTNLRLLRLSHNPLGHIPVNFFENQTELTDLYLDNVMVGLRITPGHFRRLTKLRLLSLTNNQLTTLSPDLVTDFDAMRLTTLYLDGNLWRCDCQLRWLIQWYNRRRYMTTLITRNLLTPNRPQGPQCAFPLSLKESSLFNLNETLFQCPPRLQSPSRGHQILRFSEHDNVTLSCHVHADPRGDVIWFKNNTRIESHHWPRFLVRSSQQGRTNFTSNLTIVRLTRHDPGMYRCWTSNNRGVMEARFTLYVTPLYIGLKGSVILILIAIAGSGLIVLLISIAIIVYCFYGRDSVNKYQSTTAITTNVLSPLSPSSSSMHQNEDQILVRRSSTHKGDTTTESLYQSGGDFRGGRESVGQPPLSSTLPRSKRVVINISNQLPPNMNVSSSQTVHDNELATTMASSTLQCNTNSTTTDNANNKEQCPVHGSRLNYNPCPVHGTLPSQTSTPQVPPHGHPATLPPVGHHPISHLSPQCPASDIPGHKSSPCPVHGSTTNTTSATNEHNTHAPLSPASPLPSSAGQQMTTPRSNLQPMTTPRYSTNTSIATVAPTPITMSNASMSLPRQHHRAATTLNKATPMSPNPDSMTYRRGSYVDDCIIDNTNALRSTTVSLTTTTPTTGITRSHVYRGSLTRSLHHPTAVQPPHNHNQPLPTQDTSQAKHSTITLPRNFSPRILSTFSTTAPSGGGASGGKTSSGSGSTVRFQDTVQVTNLLLDCDDDDPTDHQQTSEIRLNGVMGSSSYSNGTIEEERYSTAV